MVRLEVEQPGGHAALDERLHDFERHVLGGVPHGIVHDDSAVIGGERTPPPVLPQDLGHMAAPDDAVAGSDHVDLAPFERLERLLNMARVRHDDVGVVFLRLRQHLGQAHLVVEVLR